MNGLQPGFLLLPALAAIWFWIAWRSRSLRKSLEAMFAPHLRASLLVPGSAGQNIWLAALALAWLLAAVALARALPVPVEEPATVMPSPGYILVLQLPPASAPTPGSASRFAAALADLRALRGRLPKAETAVIVYAHDAVLLVPPTADHEHVDAVLETLAPGLMPKAGADHAGALALASRTARRNGMAAEMLWVTDAGEVEATSGTVGRRVIFHYGERAPAADSASGPGTVLLVAGSREAADWQPPAADNAPLPAGSGVASGRQALHFAWLMAVLLPAFLIVLRPALLSTLLVCGALGVLGLPGEALAGGWRDRLADLQAWRAWETGRPDQAAAGFADPCWRATAAYRLGRYEEAAAAWRACPSADGSYNRGNALARAGHLEEAAAAYESALRQDPEDADSRFNLGIVRRLKPPPPPPPPPRQEAPAAGGEAMMELPQQNKDTGAAPLPARRLQSQPGGRSQADQREFIRRVLAARAGGQKAGEGASGSR